MFINYHYTILIEKTLTINSTFEKLEPLLPFRSIVIVVLPGEDVSAYNIHPDARRPDAKYDCVVPDGGFVKLMVKDSKLSVPPLVVSTDTDMR